MKPILFSIYSRRPFAFSGATATTDQDAWTPTPLKTWFWVPFVCVLVAGAITLEVALSFSHRKHGWATSASFSSEEGILHYVYTLPPVGVAMIIVGLWTWTDMEIKRLQLSLGSLGCLFQQALASDSHLPYGSSLPRLSTTLCRPVSRLDLYVVYSTYSVITDDERSLVAFLGASGYASSSILYNLGDTPFVHNGFTVGEIELPYDVANTGNLTANTTAIFTDPGCREPDNNVCWTNSAVFSGCNFTWEVNKSSVHLFGAEIMPDCSAFDSSDPAFMPVIFWFFTYEPAAAASVTLCAPTIQVQNVAIAVDLGSSNLTSVTTLGNVTAGEENFTQFAGNVTGDPLDGRAYNGLNWTANQLVSDPFVNARATAIQLQLPAAVFQSAEQSQQGLTAAFANNSFAELSATVYRTYLAMLAKLVYFVEDNEPINVRISTTQKRLTMSDIAVHLLSAGMLTLSLFTVVVQLLHKRSRQDLRLLHQPGTLASAASFTASTGTAALLDGQQRREDLYKALRDRKFRINPVTNKIVMEGEPEYPFSKSPNWRKSFFGSSGRAGQS
ncbi:uncharacterized protein STEHIDRAFT_65902 [Stereum hirsutum FP-91666 SS1]|uniref:uncharacterized protein n=1 Tax=Stereum hirsutum (strain FP-91666) TaxID=721885 RepID=UPI0004449D73|nr:uncharacterized protein STEHIDRAFT_65902 [Stereum hirsutum FP-91666 SS1]EIM82094.1 hypothetical protein STEHIDRAFT_65902 [Stereum hirsutum FP-91666 SS1]